jgi:hypothetical protein
MMNRLVLQPEIFFVHSHENAYGHASVFACIHGQSSVTFIAHDANPTLKCWTRTGNPEPGQVHHCR